MATKERAGEKLLRFPRRDTVNVSRRAFLGLAKAGVGFLLGAVLAGAELFGLYAPFGVAAVAAAGSGVSGFCTLAGTCLGYLCLEGLTDGMRYAASAILVYAVAFAFFDTKAYRTAWFMPAIASLLCALTGIICRGGGRVARRGPDLLRDGSPLRRGLWGGILAGAAAGVALDLSSGKDPYYSMVFAMAGLACGFCRNQRKILTALVYLMACLAAVLWSRAGLDYLGLPIEAGVGAVLFLLLPGKKKTEEETEETAALPQSIAAPETDTSRETLARRLDEMAGAFHTLYDSVKDTLHPEDNNTENPAELFTRTADRVCVKCVLRSNCWQRDYEDTKRALNDATPPMMERGRALSTDFNGIFQSRCVHFPEFLGEVNRQLTAFLRRRQARRRTRAARAALCSQYARLDRFLQGAAEEVSAGLTPDLPRQEKLAAYLKSMNQTGGAVYYDREGRLRVETPATGELASRSARRELEEILGTPLREGQVRNGRLLFAQSEPFRATVSLAGAPRQGEAVSGDTGIWFRREDGMLFLLLCDGMGSGAGAKRESAQAGKLVENFLRAGMEPGEAVETVSSALALRGEDGGSTTIDLLSFDLFSGRCCVHKQGAAPTYIRRGGQVKCAVGASLPAGIVTGRAARPDVHKFRGEPGDWIVMVTDGILCGREDQWLRDVVTQYTGSSPSELAQRILRESQTLCQGEDDGTVLAARLDRSREK